MTSSSTSPPAAARCVECSRVPPTRARSTTSASTGSRSAPSRAATGWPCGASTSSTACSSARATTCSPSAPRPRSASPRPRARPRRCAGRTPVACSTTSTPPSWSTAATGRARSPAWTSSPSTTPATPPRTPACSPRAPSPASGWPLPASPTPTFEDLTIGLGSGADTFTVDSTHAGPFRPTTIFTNAGADLVVIRTVSGPLAVDTGSENDTVRVSSTVNGIGGSISGITALLTVEGGSGTNDRLFVDDVATTSPVIGVLDDHSIAGLGMTLGGSAPRPSLVQVLTVLDAADGRFTLTVAGLGTTTQLDFDASAATVRKALEALPGIDPGDVVVARAGGRWTITWAGALAGENGWTRLVSLNTVAAVPAHQRRRPGGRHLGDPDDRRIPRLHRLRGPRPLAGLGRRRAHREPDPHRHHHRQRRPRRRPGVRRGRPRRDPGQRPGRRRLARRQRRAGRPRHQPDGRPAPHPRRRRRLRHQRRRSLGCRQQPHRRHGHRLRRRHQRALRRGPGHLRHLPPAERPGRSAVGTWHRRPLRRRGEGHLHRRHQRQRRAQRQRRRRHLRPRRHLDGDHGQRRQRQRPLPDRPAVHRLHRRRRVRYPGRPVLQLDPRAALHDGISFPAVLNGGSGDDVFEVFRNTGDADPQRRRRRRHLRGAHLRRRVGRDRRQRRPGP